MSSAAFVKVSVKWWSDDDVSCSWAARGLWIALLSNSGDRMSDGHISERAMAMVTAGSQPEEVAGLVAELVDDGLLCVTRDATRTGWDIVGYDEWQTTKAEIVAKREAAAERARKYRENRKNKPNTSQQTSRVTETVTSRVNHATEEEEEIEEENTYAASGSEAQTVDRETWAQIFEALANTCEGTHAAALTKSQAGRVGVAASEIIAAGCTGPDQVRQAAANYKREQPDWTITAKALASHWGKFANQQTGPPAHLKDFTGCAEEPLQ